SRALNFCRNGAPDRVGIRQSEETRKERERNEGGFRGRTGNEAGGIAAKERRGRKGKRRGKNRPFFCTLCVLRCSFAAALFFDVLRHPGARGRITAVKSTRTL